MSYSAVRKCRASGHPRGRTATMKAAVFHNYNPDREDYRQTLKDVRPDAKGRGVAGRWLTGNDWPLETEQSSNGEQQRQEAPDIWNRVQPREFGEVFLIVVFSALHSLLVAAHSWPQKNKGERLSNIVTKLATLHVIFLIVFCTSRARLRPVHSIFDHTIRSVKRCG